ncbi:aminoglycoside phosphotransferase family protein [Alicyclobacillus curvatus]|nr:aminoglycoside phosphotransferase family protein [Alicyclobacillus curvatus]
MSDVENVKWGRICALLDIGVPVTTPHAVTGGLLHHMWQIVTDKGVFAVKVLNQEIMSRPGAKMNYRMSERVARRAHQNGITAVLAKTFGDDPWIEFDGDYFMAFDWVEGDTLRPDECTETHAFKIGSILYQLHQLKIAVDDIDVPAFSIPDETWNLHVDEAREQGIDWGAPYEQFAHQLVTWGRRYAEAAQNIGTDYEISHRDLDPKNVIWTPELTPYLIDWESAGYVHATVELMEAAINWSRSKNGMLDKGRFQAMLSAYLKAGGRVEVKATNALWVTMGGMLGWLEYNMRRSLDERTFGREERELGRQEVKHTFQALTQLAESLPEYTSWVEEVKGSVL